jgi:hypothetical protein
VPGASVSFISIDVGGRIYTARTDARGEYQIAGVKDGKYWIAVYGSSSNKSSQSVVVSAKTTLFDLVLPSMADLPRCGADSICDGVSPYVPIPLKSARNDEGGDMVTGTVIEEPRYPVTSSSFYLASNIGRFRLPLSRLARAPRRRWF